MEQENIFDHGISTQHIIIKPFVDNIQRRSDGEKLSKDFSDFFLEQLARCIDMVAEREVRPSWVKNLSSYREKSEIAIFLSLFSAIDLPDEPTDMEREIVSRLYNRVSNFGKGRNWDLKILHIQFVSMMGMNMHSYIMHVVMPKKLDPIDYN